jgi:adenine-specific DNA-methyltransferase
MTELNFKGKEFVYNHHLSVPFRPLVPHPSKGVGPVALDGNLIIHGDNLHALKALMPIYAGKVDCVFIDPPYNTGNEGWCYNDNVNAPMIKEWLASNPVTIEDGLRHDKWCAMMWPRLRLLHDLLSDEGSFWMTLDSNEAHSGIAICNEIFGKANFIESIAWRKKVSPANDARFFSGDHDYLICYAKNKELVRFNRLTMNERQKEFYKNPDKDPRGPWNSTSYTCNKTADERPNLYYPVKNPNTGKSFFPKKNAVWAFSKERYKQHEKDDVLYWGADGKSNSPRLKKYLSDAGKVVPRSVWMYDEVGHTQEASLELTSILGNTQFNTPKPTRLLLKILEIATDASSLVLDSFAGSGATGHAVLEANKRDGGSRNFVLVEMEGYADKITAERVRRVIKGYKFSGTRKTELLREDISWRTLTKADELVKRVDGIENIEGYRYSRIKKEIKNEELIVTGETSVTERTDGLGGSFTYCSLDGPLELDKILSGDSLPSYAAIGSVLFHMATNQALAPSAMRATDFYLGKTESQHVWLIYRPDLDWLKSPDAALTLSRAKEIAASDKKMRHLVFAPARFVSQSMLVEQNIPVDFAPLPFALYRIDRS